MDTAPAPHPPRPSSRLTLAWSLGLPLCYLAGWSIGYFLYPYSVIGSEWGAVIGLSVGGAVCGLAIAFELHGPLGRLTRPKLGFLALGWAAAFFALGWFWLELALRLD